MRQQDKLEGRCREMAAATGLDPEARVAYREGRTQPAWCQFREAAREERNKSQRDEAAHLAESAQQPEQFKNAPLKIFGNHDEQTLTQMETCMKVGNTVSAVICADGHLGYAQPVGGVIAYERQISVSGVGFDIGCGNMAAKLDVKYEEIKERASQILADIRANISFGVGRTNDTRVDNDLFDDEVAWDKSGMMDYHQKARTQLGTVGSGNHYIDLFRDENDFVWIGNHFGSRGLGHTIATRYLKLAGGKDGIHVPPTVLDEGSELGQRYLAGMELAGRYAYAGREWVISRVRKIIGGTVTHSVHNHHNYAWRETHNGRDLWVVRKGATPAWPGQEGFVGGSMGENAVIIEGVESEQSRAALYSTVHGAGRMFGRKEAKRRFTQQELEAWLQKAGVLLSGGDLDESPMAYKRLPDVLNFHAGTIKINHTLKPFAVAMAGDGEFDPWKD